MSHARSDGRWQHILPAALRFVSAVDGEELMVEAVSGRMPAHDIAQKVDVDEEKLGTPATSSRR